MNVTTPGTCYIYSAGEVVAVDVLAPCGVTNQTNPQVPCCWKGDTCMNDGICSYEHGLNGGSGYVASGCTDPGFGNGCRTVCMDNAYGDIMYDSENSIWRCCSYPPGGPLNCSTPTVERFRAPSPEDLISIQYLPKTGTPTYQIASASQTPTTTPSTNSPSPTSTPSTNSSSTTSTSSGGGISSGVAAGIGVGVAAGVIILVAFAFFIWKWRRRRQRPPYPPAGSHKQESAPPTAPPQELPLAPASPQPVEVEASTWK
ncbi:hypothetical protein EJ04DRAFT_338699 [Polyplosphaeria fusca]|uniref:Uncharacterized protein n=1 Tax=Polyplosphaeria fusca TaxID=682080 RepID=A0A9P4V1K0_9PLEO|nr:hypothetical protein EJ04DRAFT_338699 [Polyplosphaeria fusca]